MEVKTFELRDIATFIPVLALNTKAANDSQRWLLSRAGFNPNGKTIMITHLAMGRKMECDPYAWGDRTWTVAHLFIEANWDNLKDGDVIDVEHILGESTTKKLSERITSKY